MNKQKRRVVVMRRLGQVVAVLSLLCLVTAGGVIVWSARHGTRYLTVQSGSMVPALQVGDVVVMQPDYNYQVGDVVTYKNADNVLVTHRVQSIDTASGKVVTKGDHNESADTPIRASQIVGAVTHVVPNAGVLMTGKRPMLIMLLFVYVPALFIVGREIGRLNRYFADRPKEGVYANHAGIYTQRKVRYSSTDGARTIAGIAAAVLVLALHSQYAHAYLQSSAQLTSNLITSVEIPTSYAVCRFPSNEALLSYAAEDAYFPELPDKPLTLDSPIYPGMYGITMESHDHHTTVQYQVTQLNERWLFELYDAAGNVVATSGITQDLPNSMDGILTTQELQVNGVAVGIRYIHEAALSGLEIDTFGGRRYDDLSYAEQRRVIWSSIHPGCVDFTRQVPQPAEVLEDR